MAGGIEDRKRALRALIRSERSAASESETHRDRERLAERLCELVRSRGARSLSCFLPVRGEPDTTSFLEWASGEGVEVLLPVSLESGLLDWVRLGDGGTRIGAFGVPEPIGEALGPLAVAGVDLMLIPAAAVDGRGRRLGWGRGYFDRSLAAMSRRPPVFAVVHEREIVDEVPVEPHDMPLDGAVTPERILLF